MVWAFGAMAYLLPARVEAGEDLYYSRTGGQAMSKKKPAYPIHKMGKFCGYDEYEDGSIKIAPSHSDRFDASMNQEEALISLIKSVTEQCHKIAIAIATEKRRFWDATTEDYSLDSEKFDYTYNYETKRIYKKEKAETKP
jgi:hypothetical protein